MKKLLLFYCLALPFWAHSHSNEPKTAKAPSYVTCDLIGQLGNQLFQIATTLAYAWDHDLTPLFPKLNSSDYRLNYNRDRLFFRLNTSNYPRQPKAEYRELKWHSSETIPFKKDLKLIGYFQSWRRFDHHRDKLLEIFAPSEADLDDLTARYADVLSHPNTVGIHVRTFNADLHYSKWHPFMGMEYYRQAMRMFPENTLFVIFSDRIQWCKKHFPLFGKRCFFVEGNDQVQDLLLMSMLKHQIIANSSFSWWGAYLNQNPNKTVIAPACWMHPALYAFPLQHPNDLLPPDWIMISPDFSEPYPIDMTFYDETTSLDGDHTDMS